MLYDRPKANTGELFMNSLKQIHLRVHSVVLGSSSDNQQLSLFLFHPGVSISPRNTVYELSMGFFVLVCFLLLG